MFKRSDESLIAKALNGDQHAWQQLVNRHQSALFYFGLRLLGSQEDASDLLQDVLMVLCRNLGQYRGDSSFKSWLFGIANYRAMDMLRRRKYTDSDDALAEMPAEAAEMPEQLANQQQQQQVQQQLRKLPIEQRLVLELKFYQQFTFDEIATQLAISSNTVKSRFYAALDKMRLQLESDHVEQSANF
ncbi:RNA polymerase sigma factor [Rheinheimera baltica]|uniref:Sigma-70 family RNA polymerase sigma factor n=1 Tax=Rheinheimera baltica TaxID=67576 RepID=A0ABT9I2A5_9GAMM|nr:sigma-70 family RNA polymerase sigma factor [Rheinheimera baltica]MDP5137298.1 sigma-70 family RNA polymerase sigma factor [Rheinheimera baltica]MDP5144274.1 sigma-70 family RNA polymerase sigma factor [Rheinheimera baltica]MDP5151508.1 sigma-70 family RNA polymerase sigma factor [Rheinheimera baltica]MDP5188428.1 sigma-70 family RNA polymerase sigma factor [Rheinheimera baltica]